MTTHLHADHYTDHYAYGRAYRKPTSDPSRELSWRTVLLATVVSLFFVLPSTLTARAFEPVSAELVAGQGVDIELSEEGRRLILSSEHAGLLVIETESRGERSDRPVLRLWDSGGRAIRPILELPGVGYRFVWITPGSTMLEVLPDPSPLATSPSGLRIETWWAEPERLSLEEGASPFDKNGEPTGGEEEPPHEPADEWDEGATVAPPAPSVSESDPGQP